MRPCFIAFIAVLLLPAGLRAQETALEVADTGANFAAGALAGFFGPGRICDYRPGDENHIALAVLYRLVRELRCYNPASAYHRDPLQCIAHLLCRI